MTITIRALLVNPTAKTVTPVTFERNSLSQMYDLIECDCFDCVDAGVLGDDAEIHRVSLWVDDEGALKEPEDQRCTYLAVASNPRRAVHLAGNILVTGPADEEGEITNLHPAVTVATLTRAAIFDAPPVIPRMSFTPLDW